MSSEETHLSLSEAICYALTQEGVGLLENPKLLLGYLMDFMDPYSAELRVMERTCDEDLLEPYALCIGADVSKLSDAVAKATYFLNSVCLIKPEMARLVAVGIAEGIAAWCGVRWDPDAGAGNDASTSNGGHDANGMSESGKAQPQAKGPRAPDKKTVTTPKPPRHSTKKPRLAVRNMDKRYVIGSLVAVILIIVFAVNCSGGGATSGGVQGSAQEHAQPVSFPDVPTSHWAHQVVGRAASLGLISGYKNGKFGPSNKITRGQVAIILWRMAGKPEAKAAVKTFPDVKKSASCYKAVCWASSVGVVSGYKSGKFGPNDKITREQLAAMLANYAKIVKGKDVTGSTEDYASMKDADKVGQSFRTEVGWCYRNKLMSGTADGRINPKGNATRAQAAKMIVGLYDLVA